MRRDEQGASATEYGLLVAGIAAVVLGAVLAFGGFVDDVFEDSCDDLSTRASQTSC